MKIIEKSFPKDMNLVFAKAASFPDGIQEAFDALKSKIGHIKRVSYFGISNPEGGKGIVYKAAAATMPAVDASALGLGTLMIKGGNYYSIKLKDISEDIGQIGKAFDLILSKPDIDPEGCCIEIYDYFGSDSVECIVRREG